jgi:CheY-like chemotaxis protein
MPNQDGLAATQAIRQLNRPDAQSIPIIALTANAYDEDIRTCLKAGMNAHLAKPIASDLLYETLKHWLSNTATKKIKAL